MAPTRLLLGHSQLAQEVPARYQASSPHHLAMIPHSSLEKPLELRRTGGTRRQTIVTPEQAIMVGVPIPFCMPNANTSIGTGTAPHRLTTLKTHTSSHPYGSAVHRSSVSGSARAFPTFNPIDSGSGPLDHHHNHTNNNPLSP